MAGYNFLLLSIGLMTFIMVSNEASEYVTKVEGKVNIILLVTHGGQLDVTPPVIRRNGCFINRLCDYSCTGTTSSTCGIETSKDTYTTNITQRLSKLLEEKDLKPHQIYMEAHVKGVDVNRNLTDGVNTTSAKSKEIYNEFHEAIKSAKTATDNTGTGRAIIFDIHGNYHNHEKVELGYLIKEDALDNMATVPLKASETSIFSLYNEFAKLTNLTVGALIYGWPSFGGFLNDFGAIPSPRYPTPQDLKNALARNTNYERGGYIIREYGSLAGGKTDAIQIHLPQQSRGYPLTTDSDKQRQNTAVALAKAIEKFYLIYYSTNQVPTAVPNFNQGYRTSQNTLLCGILVLSVLLSIMKH